MNDILKMVLIVALILAVPVYKVYEVYAERSAQEAAYQVQLVEWNQTANGQAYKQAGKHCWEVFKETFRQNMDNFRKRDMSTNDYLEEKNKEQVVKCLVHRAAPGRPIRSESDRVLDSE